MDAGIYGLLGAVIGVLASVDPNKCVAGQTRHFALGLWCVPADPLCAAEHRNVDGGIVTHMFDDGREAAGLSPASL